MDQEKYLGYGGDCRLNRKVDDRIVALFKIESNKRKFSADLPSLENRFRHRKVE